MRVSCSNRRPGKKRVSVERYTRHRCGSISSILQAECDWSETTRSKFVRLPSAPGVAKVAERSSNFARKSRKEVAIDGTYQAVPGDGGRLVDASRLADSCAATPPGRGNFRRGIRPHGRRGGACRDQVPGGCRRRYRQRRRDAPRQFLLFRGREARRDAADEALATARLHEGPGGLRGDSARARRSRVRDQEPDRG